MGASGFIRRAESNWSVLRGAAGAYYCDCDAFGCQGTTSSKINALIVAKGRHLARRDEHRHFACDLPHRCQCTGGWLHRPKKKVVLMAEASFYHWCLLISHQEVQENLEERHTREIGLLDFVTRRLNESFGKPSSSPDRLRRLHSARARLLVARFFMEAWNSVTVESRCGLKQCCEVLLHSRRFYDQQVFRVFAQFTRMHWRDEEVREKCQELVKQALEAQYAAKALGRTSSKEFFVFVIGSSRVLNCAELAECVYLFCHTALDYKQLLELDHPSYNKVKLSVALRLAMRAESEPEEEFFQRMVVVLFHDLSQIELEWWNREETAEVGGYLERVLRRHG